MKLKTKFAATGAAALAVAAIGAGLAAASADASPALVPIKAAAVLPSAVTQLTDRPDSGNGGTWATDTLTRTLTLTLVSSGDGTYSYTATVTDTGSFMTTPGAFTPNQSGIYTGLTVGAAAQGYMSGSASYSFTASAPASTASNLGVPASESGAPETAPETTSYWYEQAFGPDTTFGGAGIGPWSWSYTVPAGHGEGLFRMWTDSSANGGGDLPGDGDINV